MQMDLFSHLRYPLHRLKLHFILPTPQARQVHLIIMQDIPKYINYHPQTVTISRFNLFRH